MGPADLHIHTIYSYDSTASGRAILARTKQVGLGIIAISDYNEIKGRSRRLTLHRNLA